MKKRLYFKLKEIFEKIYITTSLLTGFAIVMQVENHIKVNKGLLLVYLITSMLTACKIYFTDKLAKERGEY